MMRFLLILLLAIIIIPLQTIAQEKYPKETFEQLLIKAGLLLDDVQNPTVKKLLSNRLEKIEQFEQYDKLAEFIISLDEAKLHTSQTKTILEQLAQLEKENAFLKEQIHLSVAVGSIIPYYGTTAPNGWLLCNGQRIPEEEIYKKLINHLRREMNLSEGMEVCTPNLCDFLKGKNHGEKIGEIGGSNSTNHSHSVPTHNHNINQENGNTGYHQLSVSEIPSHSHGARDNGHNHRLWWYIIGSGPYGSRWGTNLNGSSGERVNDGPGGHWEVQSGNANISVDATGGNGSHAHNMNHSHGGRTSEQSLNTNSSNLDNRPTYCVINYIIKY